MVVDPVNQYQKLQLQSYELLMMGVNNRNMQSFLQKCNKLNKSHLVGQLLNSIYEISTIRKCFCKKRYTLDNTNTIFEEVHRHG